MLTATVYQDVDVQSPPLQLERMRMSRAANDLFSVLGAYLPAECREWAELHRPDVARYLAEGEAAVKSAAKSGTGEDFISALRGCLGHYEAAKRIYWQESGRCGVSICAVSL